MKTVVFSSCEKALARLMSLIFEKISRIFRQTLIWLRFMEEEKQKIEQPGSQVPQKEIGELMTPVESIPDETIATKEGAVFLKVLYRQSSQKLIELTAQLGALSKDNALLDKKNALLESALETKHFLDYVSSVLIGVAVVLIEKAVEFRSLILGVCGFTLIIVSVVIMWRYIGPRRGKSEQRVQ